MKRPGRACDLLALALICTSCAATGGSTSRDTLAPPLTDSVTTLLWHFDESGGTQVFDAGPLRLHGTAGVDSRTDFGLIRNARSFQRSIESFVYAPYNADMNARALTVEAWVEPAAMGEHELTVIAARWTERASEQSWMFGIVGQKGPPTTTTQSPHLLDFVVVGGITGHLVFAFQTEEAGLPSAYFSTAEIPLDRWTHVAATCDGALVKFWVDGRLDAQHAVRGTLRQTPAPLLVGNYFDPQWLSGFTGELRVGSRATHDPAYAFDGLIDELRISSGVREVFGGR